LIGLMEKGSLTMKNEIEEKKLTVATISLAGCFGCHMSFIDIDLRILDLIKQIEFNRSPLTDIKRFTKHCDIGLIEGGCCNAENVKVLKEFRENCDILVSLGECAIMGGLPAMRNDIPLKQCLQEAYQNVSTSAHNKIIPHHQELPKILDKVYPCHQIVKIDHFIPGCPPNAEIIWQSLKQLISGEPQKINYEDFKYD